MRVRVVIVSRSRPYDCDPREVAVARIRCVALGMAVTLLLPGCGEEEGNLAPTGGGTLPDCPSVADGAATR
jgi:hypothetical protein